MRSKNLICLLIMGAFLFSVPPSFSSEVVIEDEVNITGPMGEKYHVVKKEVDGAPFLEFIDQYGNVYTREEFNTLMMETTPVLSEELRAKISRIEPGDAVDVTVYMRSQPHVSELEGVRAEFELQIESLKTEIRQINRGLTKERPSLDEEGEKEYIESGLYIRETSAQERVRLQSLKEELDSTRQSMHQQMGEVAEERLTEARAETRALIEGVGGTVLLEVKGFNIVEARVPAGGLEALAEDPRVLAIDEVQAPKLRITEEPTDPFPNGRLDISTDSIGADNWWSAGYDGSNTWDFGIMDTGVQQDHPALSHTYETNTGSSVDNAESGHGTHVTGIATSSDGTYTGVVPAPDEVIWSYSSNSEATAMTNMHWLETGATDDPEAVNWSFGWDSNGSTDYRQIEQFLDAFIQYRGTPVSIASTNATGLYHPEMAYNIISVLNMNDMGTLTRSDDLDGGSAYGPTPNSRRKPDLIAPGTNIVSTNNSHAGTGSGNPDPNCWETRAQRQGYDWSRCSGTSMAAPHVGGSLVLFADAGIYNPRASKAILINTADAYDNNGTNNTTADDTQVGGSNWDPDYGWGYIDLLEAEFNKSDYFCNWTDSTHRNRLYKGYMYNNEKATLVWYKRGIYNNAAYPATIYNLTDMDLLVYRASDYTLLMNSNTIPNNVEQIDVNESNTKILRVRQWSSSIDGASSEWYCLATEENFAPYYGISTIGVRRGNNFYLRNSNSTGPHDISFNFGKAADDPLMGDWDGDTGISASQPGGKTAGVRRGNNFYLRNSNSTGPHDISFNFGKSTDEPLVGDWNGDGVDTVGIRRGNIFY